MSKFCAVYNCGSRSDCDTKMFFCFPRIRTTSGKMIEGAAEQKKRSIDALRREDFNKSKAKYAYICADHFEKGSPSNHPEHPDYIPHVKMGYGKKKSMPRFERAKKRHVKMLKEFNLVDM